MSTRSEATDSLDETDEQDVTEPEAGEGEERDESAGEGERASKPESRKPAADGPKLGERLLGWLTATYATADPRSLGAFRIALGTLLFVDVARRIPDLAEHYSNAGWLTNHFALFRPMSSHLFSVYLAFGTPAEVYVAVALHLLVNFLLLIGFKTRVMHVLAAVLIVSLNSRNILLENGGWVVLNLLTVWTMFLPLGKRYSLDAFLASLRARREGTIAALNDRSTHAPDKTPVVSLAVTALIAQWAVIYYFNTVHKGGPPWRDGTAVYYFFQQDRMVTDLGAWIRELMPLSAIKGLTWSTLVIEGAMVVLLLAPVRSGILRMVAFALCVALHLSIDLVVQLGPFSWAMMIMFVALIPARIWDWLERRRTARQPRRLVLLDEKGAVALALARIIKRFDALGAVEFLGYSQAKGTLPRGLKRKLVRSTLVVMDEARTQYWTGREAFTRLLDALPLPAKFLRLPPFGWLLVRRIERSLADRHELAERLGLEDLPGTDRVAAGPSEARLFGRRLLAGARELGLIALIVALGSQVLIENRAIPAWLKPEKRPEWMTATVVYPRLFQGWSMFAPSPPAEDGRLVVEGRTADGRRFDPLTGMEPIYEVQPKGGFRMNQIWGDFHRRIGEPRFSAYLGGVRDMLLNYHQISGRPEDRLVAFDLWYVTEFIPPPGAPRQPPQRRKLISHGRVEYPPELVLPPEIGGAEPRPQAPERPRPALQAPRLVRPPPPQP